VVDSHAYDDIGLGYWPQTPEGRVAFILALYAFAVFGYLTANRHTFFVGRDAETKRRKNWFFNPSQRSSQIAALRADIQALSRQNPGL